MQPSYVTKSILFIMLAVALSIAGLDVTTAYALQVNPGSSKPAPPPSTAKTVPPAAPPASPPSLAPVPEIPSIKEVRVYGVDKLGATRDTSNPTPVQAGIGDIILVRVHGLEDLVRHSKCLTKEDRSVPGCTEQKIALFLDGREIKGIIPESGAPRPEDEILQFHLQRNPDSDEAWADLLGAPSFRSKEFYYRPTAVSIGLQKGYALPSDVKQDKFEIIRIRRDWFIFCSILILVVLGLLIWLALTSELLRDVGPVPTGRAKGWVFTKKSHKPYSLARFQMAFWFLLVVASFLFIWLISGSLDTITGSVLALIGIGAGTAIGAAALDVGKNQSNSVEKETLQAEELTLKTDIASREAMLKSSPPPSNQVELDQSGKSKQDRLNLVQSRLTPISTSLGPKTSDGFLNDILTDEANGIAFHRFQMFVWTIVLGILFVYSVWSRLSMPEFSATLLALLGISSGTYLGFKIPEKQT